MTPLEKTCPSGRISNSTNQKYISRIEQSLQILLIQILQEGSFGKGALEITVQDGIVQNFRRVIEQVER